MTFETISVIGLGYIGLPTAAMFASCNIKVTGVDVHDEIIDTVNQGNVHIIEPELPELVNAAVSKGYLRASRQPAKCDAFLIAVPTPFQDSDEGIPQPDLSYVKQAGESIAPFLKQDSLVILESTAPVGATEQLVAWLSELRPDLSFPSASQPDSQVSVAYCPERVLPGKVVSELVDNDRIIGGLNLNSAKRAAELYKTFVKGECILTDARTAEMTKLTENSFRDVNIAFANELSIICDKLDINVWELIGLANRHPRVSVLSPGPGVGGHCIAVDPWFIVSSAPEEARLISTARQVNDSKPLWVLDKIKDQVQSYLEMNPGKVEKNLVIAFYGITFKPNIDDIRESPALEIARTAIDMFNGNIWVVEPNLSSLPRSLECAELMSFNKARELADIHVLLVDHDEFTDEVPDSQSILDTKGIWLK